MNSCVLFVAFDVGAVVAGSSHGLFVAVSSAGWDVFTVACAYGTYTLAVAVMSARGFVAAVACGIAAVIVSVHADAVVVTSACGLFVASLRSN